MTQHFLLGMLIVLGTVAFPYASRASSEINTNSDVSSNLKQSWVWLAEIQDHVQVDYTVYEIKSDRPWFAMGFLERLSIGLGFAQKAAIDLNLNEEADQEKLETRMLFDEQENQDLAREKARQLERDLYGMSSFYLIDPVTVKILQNKAARYKFKLHYVHTACGAWREHSVFFELDLMNNQQELQAQFTKIIQDQLDFFSLREQLSEWLGI